MSISREEFGNRMRAIREQSTDEATRFISQEHDWNIRYVADMEDGKYYPSMQRFMELMDQYDVPYSTAFKGCNSYPEKLEDIVERILQLSPENQEFFCDLLECLFNYLEKSK